MRKRRCKWGICFTALLVCGMSASVFAATASRTTVYADSEDKSIQLEYRCYDTEKDRGIIID